MFPEQTALEPAFEFACLERALPAISATNLPGRMAA
jgi:hypothetical protein